MDVNNRSVRLATIGSFFGFLLLGFVDNIKGPTIPILLKELNLNYSMGGTILLAAYVGFFVATIFMGTVSDIAGKKFVMIAAGAALIIGITGYSSSNTLILLVVSIAVIGIGLGSIEIGSNSIIIDIHNQNKGKYLNQLSFFHGVGSMIAPIFAGQLISRNLSWRSIYQFSLVLVLLLPLFFLIIKYPKSQTGGSSGIDFKSLGKKAFTREMLLLYVLVFSYVAAELGVSSWLVEFLQKQKSQSVVISSLFLSLYFGVMALGRLLGSFLVEKVGYIKIMLFCTLASLLCITIGVWGPPVLAFFVPLTGLFFSIIFPTSAAIVSEIHKDNLGTILGLFCSFAGIGGMIGPWVVGIFSDLLGIAMGMYMITVFCILMLISLISLTKKIGIIKGEINNNRQAL